MRPKEQNNENDICLDRSVLNEMTFALLSNMYDSALITDQDNRIIYLNSSALNLIETSFREVKGKRLNNILKFYHQKTQEEVCNASIEEELSRTGKLSCHNMILQLPNRDRSLKYVSLSVLPLSSQGKMFILKDRTEQHNLEQELANPGEFESMKLFMAGVVHDFNSILTCILGYVSLAGRRIETLKISDPKIQKWLQNSEQGCNSAKELALKLLNYSKIGTVNKKNCSLTNILKQTLEFICNRTSIGCELKYPKNPFPVQIDASQISRVFNNLLLNAVQSMPGGGKVSVFVENCRVNKESNVPLSNGKYLKISISDTGNGIDQKHKNKMFSSYFTRKYNGNGLGLFTCKRIIEEHNGHITYESVKGRGTTFFIYLPSNGTNDFNNHRDNWREA